MRCDGVSVVVGLRRSGRLLAVAAGILCGVVSACSIRRPPLQAPARVAGAAGATRDTTVPQLEIAVPAEPTVVQAVLDAEAKDSHVERDIAYLTDVIGPRLTGSPAAQRANEWTARKFAEYGLDSVWTEAWRFGRGWERGPIALTLVLPHVRQLMGASWAWAPGTAGPVEGDVIYVDAVSPADYVTRYAGAVRGTWVITRPPAFVWNSDGPAMTAADSAVRDSLQRVAAAQSRDTAFVRFRQQMVNSLAHDGALGILADGAKEFGLLTMSGSPLQLLPLPTVVLPHEDFAQLHRLLAAGERVRLRADIVNSLTPDTLMALNTVAELRGSTRPEEVVLVGAHLDSWDLATGATDNGAGAIAVLETARLLKAAGAHPARTIRFVLFTGEEEGLFGSAHYAAQHAGELAAYQAVLVLDNGTGRITGMSLQGRNELHHLWQELFAPISPLGPFAIQGRDKGGTDHLSFLPYGVPSFNYDQATTGYNHTHHSQVDTFDHVVPADLAQAATVMAVTAYELADLPVTLARGPGIGSSR
jgi:carboxypeptidase Q